MVDPIQVERTQEFDRWLRELRDKTARARIAARIRRLQSGLLGDVRALGGGLEELKLDFGPGYRVYFSRRGRQLVLLICGGDKSTQERDIAAARQQLKDWTGQ